MYLHTQDAQSGRQSRVSFTDFADWQRAARSFSGIAAFTGANANVGDGSQPADRLGATFISSNGFGVLRVRPVIGRDFTDGRRPAWRRSGGDSRPTRSGAIATACDPAIVGRHIRVNGDPDDGHRRHGGWLPLSRARPTCGSRWRSCPVSREIVATRARSRSMDVSQTASRSTPPGRSSPPSRRRCRRNFRTRTATSPPGRCPSRSGFPAG